jgi:hypothetical protein
MEYPYLSPSLVAGEFARQLPSLRRWSEARDFYRALFRRNARASSARLANLTISVWDRPDRYR